MKPLIKEELASYRRCISGGSLFSGAVVVESEIGQESTFRIYLPVTEELLSTILTSRDYN